MTNVNLLKYPSEKDWLFAKNLALGTVGKESEISPTSEWKTKLLRSEHSPIRSLVYSWEWTDLPYWISVHYVRHKIGIEHFVSTQRDDRQTTHVRGESPQSYPVTHRCVANAQAIINISKVRFCSKASKETTDAWSMLLRSIKPFSPELANLCVPSCVYRNGICPEFQSCNWNKSYIFKCILEDYVNYKGEVTTNI